MEAFMPNHAQLSDVGRSGDAIIKRRRLRALCCATMALLHRFNRDESGNVLILAGLMIPVAAVAVGASVSFSTGNATRTSMQMALDSAVLAGAIAMDGAQSSDPIATAQNAFQNNVNKFAQSSASQIAASFTVNGSIISGQASGLVTNVFGGLIGTKTYTASVTAAATKQTIPICVLGLNGSDNGSFDVNGNPTFNATCAVQANSNSNSGMTQEGKAPINAKKFGVKGGHKTNNFSPAPSDGTPTVADPYASLPFPYYDACGTGKTGLDIKNPTTLLPGTYCGGITISGSDANVTLLPGIYVMVDGPFWVKGGGNVTGKEVMIAFTGKDSSLYLWGNSTMTLTSPISGTYMNMQFMADRNNADTKGTWVSIGGAAGNPDGAPKLDYDGVAYFPTQNFWIFGNAVMNANSPSTTIVADKIWVQGSATVNITNENRRNLAVGAAPQTAYGARLLN